jgi:hypothetical protein
LLDARSAGDATTIVRGASSGLGSVLLPLLVPALALAIAERTLATHTPVGTLLVGFAAGALALLPLSFALSGFGLLAQHARGVAALARIDSEPRRRAKLDEASTLGMLAGSTHAALAWALSLLLGLLAVSAGAPAASAFGLAALATALGLGQVLLFGARAARSAVLGARQVTAEVERQLRASAPDAMPSYRNCVEAAFSAAQGASVVELGALLVAPFALGAALAFGANSGRGATLAAFGVAAVLAGLVVTLGGRATRAMLTELRRRLRGSDHGLPPTAANQSESFGELLGVTAAASVEALAFVLALTVLCLAPLLR